jgi:hypothetical protein
VLLVACAFLERLVLGLQDKEAHVPFSVDPRHPLDARSRLALVRAKVERAKQNFTDMETHLEEFYRNMSVSVEDPDVTHAFANRDEPVRTTFDALCAASDVVNNLRAALDHLVFQLIDVHSPNSPPKVFERCSFPICDDFDAYESAKRERVKGISPAAMKIIDECKPYKGGGNPLWEINEFNNIGKHRLILTVGKDVFCWAGWIGEMSMTEWFRYRLDNPHFAGIYGYKKVNEDGDLTGQALVRETQVINSNALLPKLRQFIDFVDSLINKFLPVLG